MDSLTPHESYVVKVALTQYRQAMARQRAKHPSESALYQAYSRDLAKLDNIMEKFDAPPHSQAG